MFRPNRRQVELPVVWPAASTLDEQCRPFVCETRFYKSLHFSLRQMQSKMSKRLGNLSVNGMSWQDFCMLNRLKGQVDCGKKKNLQEEPTLIWRKKKRMN